jgi:hypothetical protein
LQVKQIYYVDIMGYDNLGGIYESGNLIEGVMDDVAMTQALLLHALRDYVDSPTLENDEAIDKAAALAAETVQMGTTVITTREDLPTHARAEKIAVICIDTQVSRLDLLRGLVPEGEFQNIGDTQEELTDLFDELIEDDTPSEKIADKAMEIYATSYDLDMQIFLETLEDKEATRPAKESAEVTEEAGFLSSAKETGLEIGKISAGVIIGSLAVRGIQKYFGRQR